jgi:hypothetical protein
LGDAVRDVFGDREKVKNLETRDGILDLRLGDGLPRKIVGRAPCIGEELHLAIVEGRLSPRGRRGKISGDLAGILEIDFRYLPDGVSYLSGQLFHVFGEFGLVVGISELKMRGQTGKGSRMTTAVRNRSEFGSCRKASSEM